MLVAQSTCPVCNKHGKGTGETYPSALPTFNTEIIWCVFTPSGQPRNARVKIGAEAFLLQPALLFHLISDHNYRPPQSFINAVKTSTLETAGKYFEWMDTGLAFTGVGEDMRSLPQWRYTQDASHFLNQLAALLNIRIAVRIF